MLSITLSSCSASTDSIKLVSLGIYKKEPIGKAVSFVAFELIQSGFSSFIKSMNSLLTSPQIISDRTPKVLFALFEGPATTIKSISSLSTIVL